MITTGDKVRDKVTGEIKVVTWVGDLGYYLGFNDDCGCYYEMNRDRFEEVQPLTQDDKEVINRCSLNVRDKIYELEYYIDHNYGLSKEAVESINAIIENMNNLIKLVEKDEF